MYTSPKPTNPVVKILGIAFGAVLGLALLTSLLEGSSDEPSYLDQSAVSDGYSSGTGDTQIYESGSITTTEDGGLIYSDSSGNGFSSGG